jgi:hypothetical protein
LASAAAEASAAAASALACSAIISWTAASFSATAADDAFKLVAEINSALTAVETGTDAQSDLPDLK